MLSFFYNRQTFLRVSFYLSVIIGFFPACIPSSDPGMGARPDTSISLGDNGDYSPTSNGPISSGPESCQVTGKIAVTGTGDFGLSEQGDSQCQTIVVTPCVVFSAEIDDMGDGINAFTLKGADGNETTSRLTSQTDGIQVCYPRTNLGTHTGRLNIVLDNSAAVYAYAIPLNGTTVPHLFVDSTLHPTEGQLVCEYSVCDYNTYDATTESFTVPFNGSVNYNDLSSILNSPLDVTISAGGLSDKQTITSSNPSFSGNLHIPNAPAVYPAVFSMGTSQGTLSKTVNLVRFTSPEGLIEVRDSSGNQINAVNGDPKESDAVQIYAGINITNLPVSGPSVVDVLGNVVVTQSTHIKVWMENEAGEIKSYLGNGDWGKAWSNTNSAVVFDFYNNFDGYGSTPVFGINGLCDSNYSDPFQTYCLPLPLTTELERGTNKVKAELCNEYTDQIGSCTTIETSVLVDNDMPIITITSPKENQIYKKDDTVTVTGTIQNFTQHTYSTDVDTGELISTCAVKMWLNSSLNNSFIPLCDNLTITANTDGDYHGGNQGNIRSANFSITLPKPADNTLCGTYATDGSTENVLTCYTNLIQIKAEDDLGHVGMKVVSFQRGDYNKSAVSSMDLTTAQLGDIKSTGSTTGSPFMLDISEATLKNSEIVSLIQKFLNNNLDFTTLAMGFGPRKDEDGSVSDIPVPQSHDEMVKMLHWPSPDQIRALEVFQSGDSSKFFKADEAQDACGYPLTTSVITPDMYQYLLPSSNPVDLVYWPDAICGNDLDCKAAAPEQGNWDVKLDLKDDGFIDLTLELKPAYEGGPAYFAYMTAYDLIENGTTGNLPTLPFATEKNKSADYHSASIPDPTFPLWMNFGRLTINLEDMLRVMKAKVGSDGKVDMSCHASSGDVEPCACDGSTECVNMLYPYYNRMVNKLSDSNASNDVLVFEPYVDGCRHFHEKFPNAISPAGCDTADADTQNTFFVDRNSPQGALIYSYFGDVFVSPSLKLFDQVFSYTLIHTIACAGTQIVNPIIAPEVFPYPDWTRDDQKVSTNLALDNAADGLTVTSLDKAENPAFTFSPNLKDADIDINDGGVQLKLPMSMGATNIQGMNLQSLFNTGVPAASLQGASFSGRRIDTRGKGYMSRAIEDGNAQVDLDNMVEVSGVEDAPYLGMSLDIEEVLNAATHVLFQKGVEGIVNLIDTDIVSALDIQGSSLTINKVTLSRDPINLCNGIANPLATTSLTIQTFFNYISTLFPRDVAATSWTITLDKDSPPTFAILPLQSMHAQGEGIDPILAIDENAQLIQLGLSNVQISIHGLREYVGTPSTYEVLDEVVKIRLDGLLRIVLYYDNDRNLKVDLLQSKNSVLYASVINRGGAINEFDVVRSLVDEVFPKVLDGTFGSNYVAGGAVDAEGNPQDLISMTLPTSMAGFDDMEVIQKSAGTNDICENGPYEYKNTHARPTSFIKQLKDMVMALVYSPSHHKSAPSSHTRKKTANAEVNTKADSNNDEYGNLQQRIDDDPCFMVRGFNLDDDNPIADALCDYGIKDVHFGTDGSDSDGNKTDYPHLFIDSKTGYMHFSTELWVELYDWFSVEADK